MTYPRDCWRSAVSDAAGELLAPGLRNRRRYALWQACLLSDDIYTDADGWEASIVNETLAGRRPAARDLTSNLATVLADATQIPGGVWVFKGVYAVVGVHMPSWSLLAAPAAPQRVIACFDDLPGVAVEYGGIRESSVDRVLLADAVQQLCQAASAALESGATSLDVFPPRARQRSASLAAEVTGRPYRYELPAHARSIRRPAS